MPTLTLRQVPAGGGLVMVDVGHCSVCRNLELVVGTGHVEVVWDGRGLPQHPSIRRSQRGFDRPTPVRVVLGAGWGISARERGNIVSRQQLGLEGEERESERPENHRSASL